MDWLEIIIGFCVGVLVGATGVGGGSLMTPILIFGLSIEPIVAVATDLVFAVITKSGGVISYFKHRVINWRVAISLLAGSLPSALITLWILQSLNSESADYNDFMVRVLGVALLLSTIGLLIKAKVLYVPFCTSRKSFSKKIVNHIVCKAQYKKILLVIVGAVISCMVTVSSVGAGVIVALVLFFIFPRMKTVEVVATDIAHAVPLTLVAGIGYIIMGAVDWKLLASLLVGSLPGIYLGSRLGVKVPDDLLKILMAIMFLIIGMKCLL